jgi:hypothetical protein
VGESALSQSTMEKGDENTYFDESMGLETPLLNEAKKLSDNWIIETSKEETKNAISRHFLYFKFPREGCTGKNDRKCHLCTTGILRQRFKYPPNHLQKQIEEKIAEALSKEPTLEVAKQTAEKAIHCWMDYDLMQCTSRVRKNPVYYEYNTVSIPNSKQ